MKHVFIMMPARKRHGLPDDAFAAVFSGNKVALRYTGNENGDAPAEKSSVPDITGAFSLPQANEIGADKSIPTLFIGELDGRGCFAMELPDSLPPPPGLEFFSLRETFSLVDPASKKALCRAETLLDWRKKRIRCGICGAEMTESEALESGQICPKCHAVYFPQLSPAVIVAIRKEKELLLAHNAKFKPGLYSLIAGFIEPGESAEEAVEREIFEEVGLKVKNISYIRSQPWPFPNSLMLGFEAEYAGGEIHPDGKEILDAGFFTPDAMPDIPGGETISRFLIDKFIRETAPENAVD